MGAEIIIRNSGLQRVSFGLYSLNIQYFSKLRIL
jgi:hypothetical protein